MAININRYKRLIRYYSNWPQFLWAKLSKPKSFTFKRRDGFTITVPKKMQSVFKENFFDQTYFLGFPKSSSIPDDMKVLDIGGNVGFFALYTLSNFSKAQVFSFEPVPFNYNVMKEYKEHFGYHNWSIYPQAISNDDNEISIFAKSDNSFSLMAAVERTEYLSHEFKVEAISLSSFLIQNEIDKLDLVKVDCEGSEYPILYSWESADFAKIDKLVIESHPSRNPAYTHQALVEHLEQHGYQINEKKEGEGTGYIWAWRE